MAQMIRFVTIMKRYRSFGWLASLVVALTIVMPARATLLGIYEFNNSLDVTTQPADGTFSSIQLQNVTQTSQDPSLVSTAWNSGTSIDTAEYVQFVLTPDPGFQLNLTNMTFLAASSKSQGANNGGPTNIQVRVFLGDLAPGTGNGNAPQDVQDFAIAQDSSINATFDVADFTTPNPVTVRFYSWGTENSSGELTLDNVGTEGSINVIPIPEPATWGWIGGLGLVALITGREWRRRASRSSKR